MDRNRRRCSKTVAPCRGLLCVGVRHGFDPHRYDDGRGCARALPFRSFAAASAVFGNGRRVFLQAGRLAPCGLSQGKQRQMRYLCAPFPRNHAWAPAAGRHLSGDHSVQLCRAECRHARKYQHAPRATAREDLIFSGGLARQVNTRAAHCVAQVFSRSNYTSVQAVEPRQNV